MMRTFFTRQHDATCQFTDEDRRGVTLTEVLMSMMIMSIGVSSVAVLFPIAVLRSVQATKLTNAAMLKENAQAQVEMQKGLVFDPDGDGNIDEHIINRIEQRYIVDPSGYFQIATAPTASWSQYPTLSNANNSALPNDNSLRGLCDWFGNTDTDGDGVPELFQALPRYDGGVRNATRSGTYVNGYSPNPVSAPEEAKALRLLAANLSKLGDGWETVVDTFAEGLVLSDGSVVTNTTGRVVGVKLPDDLDLSGVPTGRSVVPMGGSGQLIPDPEVCRIVVFSLNGKFSVSLPLTAIDTATNRAVWTEDTNFNDSLDGGEDLNMNGFLDGGTTDPLTTIASADRLLPTQFYSDTPIPSFYVGRVLLQTARTQDYNWLLTVRRGSDGQARGVDVVVTHNKAVTPDDERLYTSGFLIGSTTLHVFLDGGLNELGEPSEPALRKSGYVLDVNNARWYRVQAYREATGISIGSATGNGYIITLETPVIQSAIGGKALFLPGVIDVFPMGAVNLPTNR